MKHDNDNVEIFDEDSVITLYDDEDRPIDFFEIASIEYGEKFYEILQPVEPIMRVSENGEEEGIGEDEAVIFEYTVDEKTNEKLFKPIFDEELLEKVFGLYLSAAADYESCGCGCDECGHAHGCGHEEDALSAEEPAKKPETKKSETKKPADKKPADKKPAAKTEDKKPAAKKPAKK